MILWWIRSRRPVGSALEISTQSTRLFYQGSPVGDVFCVVFVCARCYTASNRWEGVSDTRHTHSILCNRGRSSTPAEMKSSPVCKDEEIRREKEKLCRQLLSLTPARCKYTGYIFSRGKSTCLVLSKCIKRICRPVAHLVSRHSVDLLSPEQLHAKSCRELILHCGQQVVRNKEEDGRNNWHQVQFDEYMFLRNT